ncbi:glutathione synthetase isoform X2 [Eurytemora carolleeae]|uniref:glutathione synthetase isoform X2 n=1 Tax=Eurytemora carolleeae TaxID=1294199 RepID=UPI000C764A89|nr:glutathione synthetase isoform X2 [Eurytemora carolleeae]|eukprot:XP_023333170.1 glutathione synthetase-like isoform X2 [Eurytemora affinis]
MGETDLYPCVPLEMSADRLDDLVDKAKTYALMHGICMRRKDAFDTDALHFAPFVLFPSPFPRKEFNKAIEIQTILNELMHKVAHDDDFLRESLKNTIQVDDFTGRLFQLYDKVQKHGGSAQVIEAGLFRSDYFYCQANKGLKQVEFNTIASSFGCLTSKLVDQHKYVVQEAGYPEHLKNIPENNALSGLANALVNSWKLYNQPKSVILFLVEDVTYNICDQKFHEFEIREQCPEVFVIRKTLTEIGNRGKLTEDKRLIIDGHEVAVIYMRCGYHPDQYPSEVEWDARFMMEMSLAIKSPSVHYHLAGTKKVQQELAKPGVLEKFLGDKAKIESVRDIFTGLYSLDKDEIGNASFQRAIETPEKFVLKPQREGGGNNVYGADIKPFLEKIADSDERSAYILMDMIEPPITTNYMVRPGEAPLLAKCISELGIFGYVIGTKDSILENKQVGHMLRTKLSHVNEGGVAAGLGALDSVYLVDASRCCLN